LGSRARSRSTRRYTRYARIPVSRSTVRRSARPLCTKCGLSYSSAKLRERAFVPFHVKSAPWLPERYIEGIGCRPLSPLRNHEWPIRRRVHGCASVQGEPAPHDLGPRNVGIFCDIPRLRHPKSDMIRSECNGRRDMRINFKGCHAIVRHYNAYTACARARARMRVCV